MIDRYRPLRDSSGTLNTHAIIYEQLPSAFNGQGPSPDYIQLSMQLNYTIVNGNQL